LVIVALIYLLLVWLVFSRLKLLSWNWTTGTATVLLGLLVVAVFDGFLNYLTPAGRVAVVGRVVEVTSNVAGQIIDIPVQPNRPVKPGTVLFRIDPTPFKYKVKEFKAQLVEARQRAEQLKANFEAATADVKLIDAQLDFATRRRDDYSRLVRSAAASEFRLQDEQKQVDTLLAQQSASKARQTSARLALESEIDGVNTQVVRLTAQVGNAEWELEHTTFKAPADGYVSAMALTVGDRATPLRSVLSFIVTKEVQIVGIFSQNGFRTIKPGAFVQLAFANNPGRMYRSTIADIIGGVGEGQVATSGILVQVSKLPMTTEYPVQIHLPSDLDPASLRLGMSGTATVFAEGAGPIGFFGWLLLWMRALALYL